MLNSKNETITPDELISEQARIIKNQQDQIDSFKRHQQGLEYIASYYKASHQVGKTVEELAELIKALVKGEAENIVEEMADVENMIAQLKFLFGVDTTHIRNQKIERQINRILEEKKKKYTNGERRP